MTRYFLILLIFPLCLSSFAKAEVILQYFNTPWREIEARIPELAETGYSSLWLPPPFKAGAGAYSVGFDTFDRFDLGNIDQSGSLPTKYGTRKDFLSMMRTAHRFGIRVYFDNVMAHNAGHLNPNTKPGELFPDIPGFVPEDFHIGWNGSGWQKFADWPDWNNEWQILNRNPFAWDISHEGPENTSFDAWGLTEGTSYPKWVGIRHPGKTHYYPDTDLTITNPQTGDTMHPFADKEPFEDHGLDGIANTGDTGENNGRFDWVDSNKNGQHDPGEASEPFSDIGVDGTVPWRKTVQWGYGDGIYNMGNPVPEDVNGMLLRAVKWFVDQSHADGFRLDAVKHVPSYFFGKQHGSDKDYVNWGYNGAIQEQFNISRGFEDWNNHRDSVFNTAYQARDDALLYGEHLGTPPAFEGYLNSGMRIATDGMLNGVKDKIGGDLSGMDQGGWGHYNGNASQSMSYIMSHDNTWLYGGDRPQALSWMILKEGIPIVYTDGYHIAGAPDYFPKPAYIPFLGQHGENYLPAAMNIHRDFVRGYQRPRWSDRDFIAFERIDDRENKQGGSWNGATLLVMMARNYIGGYHSRPDVQCSFPSGATLKNYSPHGGGFYVVVQPDGKIRNEQGQPVGVPSNGYYAFSWRVPEMPAVWDGGITAEKQPIEIYQNGQRASFMPHVRRDGPDGDPGFNPHGLYDDDSGDYQYTRWIPRVTDGTNLTFLARSDGSAENILMKLNGGIDINSHLGMGPQGANKRDFAPGRNDDQRDDQGDGDLSNDTINHTSIDTYLGYEQMQFVRRVKEKFAAADTNRNVIGSPGAESYEAVIGNAGVTIGNGNGVNSSSGTASWIFHDPAQDNQLGSSPLQFFPAPENAANQEVTIWVKVGYKNSTDVLHLYYTTDGESFPEGSAGTGKGNTQVIQLTEAADGDDDGNGLSSWWTATLPAMPANTTLRYKIGGHRYVTSSIFPWSKSEIDKAKRMETVFHIPNFDATAATYHIHNDYGKTATGLDEGFHVLRSRAMVNRTDGSSIFKTNVQTFYYDTKRPEGEILFPKENDTIAGSSYGAVIHTDASVTEVWYKIDDIDGSDTWKKATSSTASSLLRDGTWRREWRFEYESIPNTGSASIQIRLLEASSSRDFSLSDADGWFTTLTRNVTTGSPANWNIGVPGADGEVWQENWLVTMFFKKELIPNGMSDADFLSEVSVYIASTQSGQPADEILQPSNRLSLVRDVNENEHAVEFRLPNLYNGEPDFLHHLRAVHQRGSIISSDTKLLKAAVTALPDSDGDRLPDIWEQRHGLQPNNPHGAHGNEGDYDEDTLSNEEEYVYGLSPTQSDAQNVPKQRVEQSPQGGRQIVFDALKGCLHHVQWSDDMKSWHPLWENISVDSNREVTIQDQGAGSRVHPDDAPVRYYRVTYERY